ncbi:hypothetical protein BpHYR1_027939 [Brachionus plicatilis]|uniref:Uncharacterized protein n=1 Tax=Brachionus plicatilis TaxID=10195 RepID=A0A3M7PZ14_BRAPC|nr:hypothetical protein BpHYR1_027939 [Brachionus plicatilis]
MHVHHSSHTHIRHFLITMPLMEDQRRCWKVSYIVYYCNLFEKKLDLIGLRVDEFEDALLDDCGKKSAT